VGRRAVDQRAPLMAATRRIDQVGRRAVDQRAPLMAATRRIDQVGRRAVDQRAPLVAATARIERAGRAALLKGARELAVFSRAPMAQLERHRAQLHQKAREIRAASRRGIDERLGWQRRIAATVLDRKVTAAGIGAGRERIALTGRVADLERAARTLAERQARALKTSQTALNAHDPQRTLERGYALVMASNGDPIAEADGLRAAGKFDVRMADGTVAALVDQEREGRPDGRD
jgi:exodeoxyribonuclease VII large subunit